MKALAFVDLRATTLPFGTVLDRFVNLSNFFVNSWNQTYNLSLFARQRGTKVYITVFLNCASPLRNFAFTENLTFLTRFELVFSGFLHHIQKDYTYRIIVENWIEWCDFWSAWGNSFFRPKFWSFVWMYDDRIFSRSSTSQWSLNDEITNLLYRRIKSYRSFSDHLTPTPSPSRSSHRLFPIVTATSVILLFHHKIIFNKLNVKWRRWCWRVETVLESIQFLSRRICCWPD
jgi:hypothetical protein